MTKEEQLDRIIRDEVLAMVNTTAAALQEVDEFWTEEAEHLERAACPHCGWHLPKDLPKASEDHSEYCYQCPSCEEPFDDPEHEAKEVMQWYIVSDWLADKLKEQDEIVWAPYDITFWGRCSCNYALTEESCLKDIAEAIAS